MPRKKKETVVAVASPTEQGQDGYGTRSVGDPFFDDPPEVYWARMKKEQGHDDSCTIDVPPRFNCNCSKGGRVSPLREPKIYTDPDAPRYDEGHDKSVEAAVAAEESVDDTERKTEELNKLFIPLGALRLKIAEIQASGVKKMPLGDLIHEIHAVYRESLNDDE